MYDLPTQVEIGGKAYNIRKKADYRVIMDIFAALGDTEISEAERVISALMIFYEDLNSVEDITAFGNLAEAEEKMASFISMGEVGYKADCKLIDWVQDEKLIVSAVNNVARTEIRALPYLHWWTFTAYYMAVGECTLSMIVGIRYKIAHHKKLEAYERDFRRRNPHYFEWDNDRKEARRLLEQIWED